MPARPPVPGTSTPNTVASSTCGSVDTAASTSGVATFSPFQRIATIPRLTMGVQ